MGARFCLTCGSQKLTDPTLYLPLGGVSWLLSWLLVILTTRWLWPYTRRLGEFALHLVLPLLACLAERVVTWIMVVAVVYLLLSAVLPKEISKLLRQAAAHLLRLVWRLTLSIVRGSGMLFRTFLGRGRKVDP